MKKLLLSSDDLWHQIKDMYGSKGGVYKLHCYSDIDQLQIMTTNRLLGTDEDGVLYIGKAISFLDRVINLKKSISPEYKGSSHICGNRYKNDTYKNLRAKFTYSNLCVSFIESDNPEKDEKKEIEEYCKKFGEPPPLNRME